MSAMPCSNTAELERYETDELLQSYFDRTAERNQAIADRRDDRRATLLENVDALDEAIHLNLDYGELKELLGIFVPKSAYDGFVGAVVRDAAARRVVEQLVERVLDVEQELGNFG